MDDVEPISRLRGLLRGRILRNISWLSLSYVLSKPLWFAFITAGCMRLLSPEGYGVFTTSLALVMLASAASDLGTTEYTVREVARRPALASRLLTNLLLGRLGLALAGLLVALGVALALEYPPHHLHAVLAASLYIAAFRAAEYGRAFFRAFEELRDEAAFTVVEKVLVVALGMAALVWLATPFAAFLGMAAGMWLTLGALFWRIHRRYAPFRLRLLRPAYAADVMRRAAPLGLIALFSVVPIAAGPILVDVGLGTEAAGLYGAAQRIVEAFMLLTTIVVAALFARLSALYFRGDRRGYGRLLGQALLGTTALALAVAVAVSLTAPLAVRLLAGGEAYAAAGPVLTWFALLFPLMNATALSVCGLIAADGHRFAILTTGVAAGVSVGLMLLLIPHLGLYGPVVALGATYLLLPALNLWRCRTLALQPAASTHPAPPPA